ncbi:hypothetical protein [Mangrovicoccus ximenensis]|uniref:hypothetical protein n=1 Tax=Mangrovicoccus ximenensis TaxID=1911570 RepID=UPI000D3C5CBE|nr:hypothetical protein [Mangrovicoccus ximenensis]
MPRLAALCLPAAALLVLGNCSAGPSESGSGDPGALACREGVHESEDVDLSWTSARPAGPGAYDVFVGAESFRCTVGSGDSVTSLTRT